MCREDVGKGVDKSLRSELLPLVLKLARQHKSGRGVVFVLRIQNALRLQLLDVLLEAKGFRSQSNSLSLAREKVCSKRAAYVRAVFLD